MGTAVGDHIEAAMTSEEVRSHSHGGGELEVRGCQMSVLGHVDLVGPDWMTDIKSEGWPDACSARRSIAEQHLPSNLYCRCARSTRATYLKTAWCR